MSSSSARAAGSIPLEFRIAVAGHRYLRDDDPALRAAVDAEIQRVQDSMNRARAMWTTLGLTIVSPLAEGADRIVAHAGTRVGARLEVILPLVPEDYCDDFDTAHSKAEFEHLLSAADRVSTVRPARTREGAYRRAGRAIVDRADLLLLLWDGQPARGVGGTAELVDYARRAAVPVRIIPIDPQTRSVAGPTRDSAGISGEIRPLTTADFAKYETYNRWLSHHPARAEEATGSSAFDAWFAPFLAAADNSALEFQRRFKATARLLFALSAIAVVTVAGQLIFDLDHRLVWIEVGCLVLLLGALNYSRSARMLDRWTSSRYLAERLRSSPFLALVGVDLPMLTGGSDADVPQEAWVQRAVMEVWCHGPSVNRPPEPDVAALRTTLIDSWVQPQVDYHRKTANFCRRALRRTNVTATTLFALSAVAAIMHSTGYSENSVAKHWISLVSVIVPAVGAAIHGYAALRDYRRQKSRSDAMSQTLVAVVAELEQVKTLPDLRRLAVRIDQRMLGDSAEWYSGTISRDLELAG